MNEYFKYYLVKDVVLAVVMVATAWAWYQLLGTNEQNEAEMEGDTVAELVPLHGADDS